MQSAQTSLLIAIRRGFQRGAPHLPEKAVARYLPPRMATSKGHMKRPCKGIHSTTLKQPPIRVLASVPDPSMPNHIEPYDPTAEDDTPNMAPQCNIIDDIDDQSIANRF
jgi:hypothetical protein